MKTQTLVNRHAQDIKGVIECFDRPVTDSTLCCRRPEMNPEPGRRPKS